MEFGEKLSVHELNTLLNSWPEGTQGHEVERRQVIPKLDAIGAAIGYGALAQLAQWLYEIQCHADPKNAAALKRERFKAMGWKLPDDFERVAAK